MRPIGYHSTTLSGNGSSNRSATSLSALFRGWTLQGCLLSLIVMASASICHGEEFHNAVSLQGFTGLLNTPNAAVTDEGKFYALFSNQKEALRKRPTLPPREESYIFSVGLFQLLELGGRLTESRDANDLSGNVKLTVPFIPQGYYLPSIALGMQDFSGGGNNKGSSSLLRTKYIVATEDLWRFRVSLGYGTGPDRMEGVFGGAEFKACDWVYLIGENDAKDTNVGIRLVTPSIFGYPVNLQVTAKTALSHRAGNTDFGFGLQFPLGFDRHNTKPLPEQAQKTPSAAPAGTAVPVASPASPEVPEKTAGGISAPLATPDVKGTGLAQLRKKLVEAGFQNIRIGTRQDSLLVVEYENSRFNHNELDGLGVVAGIVVDTVPSGYNSLSLILKKKNIKMLRVSAPLEEFRLFLHDAGRLETFKSTLDITADVRDEEGLEYLDGYSYPSLLRSSLVLYPGLQTIVGNENGAFNYLLSLKADYYLNAWKGAVVNARWDFPVSWSENYDDGKPFRGQRQDSQLERLMLFQAVKIAPTVMLNLGGGMFLHDSYGTLNEALWAPGDGQHRFRLTQAYLTAAGNRKTDVYLGSYRYYFNPLDVYIEGTAGKFFNEDKGFTAELKRFFGDTSFSLYYKNTRNVSDERIQVGGVQFTFPLTPRRDMKPYPLQVRGTDEWSYAQETRISSSNLNFLYNPVGINPQPFYRLDHIFYNRDRLSEPYIRKHLLRLRDAYLTYREE